jgi:hypothetical protein
MKRLLWAALASVGLGGWFVAPASAQLPGYVRPYQNPYPAFSPILNMQGSGTNSAINYFGIVRPQMQTSSALQQLQTNQQLLLSSQAGGMTAAATMPLTPDGQAVVSTTGHPVGINDWTRYFPVRGFYTGAGGIGGYPGIGPYGGGYPGMYPGAYPGIAAGGLLRY